MAEVERAEELQRSTNMVVKDGNNGWQIGKYIYHVVFSGCTEIDFGKYKCFPNMNHDEWWNCASDWSPIPLLRMIPEFLQVFFVL